MEKESKFGYKWNLPTNKYYWTEDMDDVSGFGGEYEEVCRFMLVKALEFWDSQNKFNPKFSTIKGVSGLMKGDNKEAEELRKYMIKSVTDYFDGWEPSMLQFEATVGHSFWIKRNGWEKFKTQMIERKKREAPTRKKVELPEEGDGEFHCINCGKDVQFHYTKEKRAMECIQEHAKVCNNKLAGNPPEKNAEIVGNIIKSALVKDEDLK